MSESTLWYCLDCLQAPALVFLALTPVALINDDRPDIFPPHPAVHCLLELFISRELCTARRWWRAHLANVSTVSLVLARFLLCNLLLQVAVHVLQRNASDEELAQAWAALLSISLSEGEADLPVFLLSTIPQALANAPLSWWGLKMSQKVRVLIGVLYVVDSYSGTLDSHSALLSLNDFRGKLLRYIFVSEVCSLGALWFLHRRVPMLIEDRPYIPSPMNDVQLDPDDELLLQIICVLLIIFIIMDQCRRNVLRAWSLLRERGYHLDVFLYLLATCLTPAGKALGRPLLLVELYAGVYAVYRFVLMVGWVIVFCAEYFDAPPLVIMEGAYAQERMHRSSAFY